MNFALIIQGTSASGKSTVARKIAMKREACYLESDFFIFAIQPFRPLKKRHIELGIEHLWSCFTNIVKAKENLILEGALIDRNKKSENPFLQKYISYLERHNYKILRVFLVSSLEVAEKRMATREVWEGHTGIVHKDLYLKLKRILEKTVPASVPRIDTTNLTADDVTSQVEELMFE